MKKLNIVLRYYKLYCFLEKNQTKYNNLFRSTINSISIYFLSIIEKNLCIILTLIQSATSYKFFLIFIFLKHKNEGHISIELVVDILLVELIKIVYLL